MHNKKQFQDQDYDRYFSGQDSSQSWSQPVRYDEVPQSSSHFGKGFKRFDDRIREEVSEALFHDLVADANETEDSSSDHLRYSQKEKPPLGWFSKKNRV